MQAPAPQVQNAPKPRRRSNVHFIFYAFAGLSAMYSIYVFVAVSASVGGTILGRAALIALAGAAVHVLGLILASLEDNRELQARTLAINNALLNRSRSSS